MNATIKLITPFLFGESTLRTTILGGCPWFVAKDVCAVLGLENTARAVESLQDKEKITITNSDSNPRAGIPHEMTYVNEPGLYRLIFKSRKAEALAFQDWVFTEVLPSIRKRGIYGTREYGITVFVKELMDMGLESRDAAKLALSAFPPLSARERKDLELKEANESGMGDEETRDLLASTTHGSQYRIKDLFSLLPTTHRIMKIKAGRGRETALGNLMESLVRTGHFLRINARYATYERTCEKIVSIR
jgi:prophage antirepressor-like protein